MQKISVAYILNDKKELLILKRSPSKKTNPNKWHVLSGVVEQNETPVDCLFREIEEELGIDFLWKVKKEKFYIDIQDDGEWETNLFIVEYLGGDIVLNNENTEYRWVTKNTLLSMDIIQSILEDLKHIKI